MISTILDDLAGDKDQLSFLNRAIHARNKLPPAPAISIPCIGSLFCDQAYADHILDTVSGQPEKLVVDLRRLDCMTLIEYIEAIRRSPTMRDFVTNLVHVRYLHRVIDYSYRRHFFRNWVDVNDHLVADVTKDCGCGQARQVHKILNQKEDGSLLLPGIPSQSATISYIPTEKINTKIISNIHDGDYIGIYSPDKGLDVTHVGIMVRNHSIPFLRHASSVSSYRRVIDHPFLDYLHGKFSKSGTIRPGIIVFRATTDDHGTWYSNTSPH
jgi:hypothetical protein